MSIRNRVILFVMLIITGLTSIFYYFLYKGYKQAYDKNIQLLSVQLDQCVKNEIEILHKTYLPRMKGFIQTNPQIIEVFKQQNREQLFKITLPRFKVLKEENAFLFGFTYILPDHTIFLRMQQPDFFGDSVSNIPFARHILEEEKISIGFSITKIGAFYRIVIPVYDKQTFLGAIGWAFDVSMLVQNIQKLHQITYGIFANKKRYKALTQVESDLVAIGDHVLISTSKDTDLFKNLSGGFDLHKKNQIFSTDGKIFIINGNRLQNFADEHMGDILLALDITAETAMLRKQIISATVMTIIALILSFVVLYFSFAHMLNRIEQLNKTLEQRVEKRTMELSVVNKELTNEILEKQKMEQKQKQLIHKLQKALDDIKMLRGLLPICAHCKKIRDDKGYWNNLEGYIMSHSEVKFSHGMCPECSDKLYGNEDWYIELKEKTIQKK